MATHSDQQKLDGLLQNQQAVLDDIFDDCLPAVERLVLSTGGSKHEAEDVFMTGLEALWKNAQKPGFALTSSFKTYLYAICQNIWRNELRRKKYRAQFVATELPTTLIGQSPASPETELLRHERRAAILRAFDQIGQPCADILRLAFEEGLDNDEIAQHLGLLNDGAFRTQKTRCKQEFIKKFNAANDGNR